MSKDVKIREVTLTKKDVKEKGAEKTPPYKPIIRTVRNVSGVPQICGGIEVPAGATRKIDVAPGSMGERLIAQGLFVSPQTRPAVDVPVDMAVPGVSGQYKCPWCDKAYAEASEIKAHILRAHVSVVFTE